MVKSATKQKLITICFINRRALQYSLLWPEDGTELNPGFEFKIKIFFYMLLSALTNCSLCVHAYITTKENGFLNPEDLALTITGIGTYYMVFSFLIKQKAIALLLADLSNFDKHGKPGNFEKQNSQFQFYCKLIIAYGLGAVMFYNIVKSIQTYHDEQFWIWTPFEIHYFPVFEIVVIYFAFATYIHFKMCMHVSFYVCEITYNIILRLKHLGEQIKDCFEITDFEVSRAKFVKCVLYHTDILELASRFNDTFYAIMFGYFALIGIMCACIEKQIVDGYYVFAGFAHLLGWIISLYLGCVGGQHLIDASQIIPMALWNSKWYKADVRLQKEFLIMLTRSQKEFYINAGPFSALSYPLFVTVAKASYSVLCVLST